MRLLILTRSEFLGEAVEEFLFRNTKTEVLNENLIRRLVLSNEVRDEDVIHLRLIASFVDRVVNDFFYLNQVAVY